MNCQAIAEAIESPAQIAEEDRLKVANRRLVFRVPSRPPLVVKAFPLQGLRRWTGHCGYAQQECEHLLEAEARGVRVPTCLAYGERPFFGGSAWNAVVIEHISGATVRDRWLADPESIDADAVLERITPLAIQLYQTGCNHIDFGPHAIMRLNDGDCLIDWQYANFTTEPNPYVFASQIGYFGWSTATNRSWVAAERVRQWFDQLWESNQIPEYSACKAVFEVTLRKRHTIDERLQAASTFAP